MIALVKGESLKSLVILHSAEQVILGGVLVMF